MIKGLLIDLDGTVYQAGELLPGAAETAEWLRGHGFPFLFTTNTSRKSRAAVAASLRELGLPARENEILTANVAAARWLEERGVRRVQLLVADAALGDFESFDRVESAPEAVLVADLGAGFTFEVLNTAFRNLRAGAHLVAIHKNRFWITRDGPTLDAGPFVAALEYASVEEATLVGKPSPAFFALAAGMLGIETGDLAVVGDDPESDIRGGNAAGLATVQVRTGKFDPDRLAKAPPEERPDELVDSIATLPVLLRRAGA
jgi:HAD superfamily hydrolase (TIGR01458 family)